MVTWSEEKSIILDVQKRSPKDISLIKMNLGNGRGTAQFMELIRQRHQNKIKDVYLG
jgi:hypothetical protein